MPSGLGGIFNLYDHANRIYIAFIDFVPTARKFFFISKFYQHLIPMGSCLVLIKAAPIGAKYW
jgi:hypothetical protein